MQRRQHRQPALGIQPPQQFQDLDLIADIEMGGRLIQQQDWRLLRQRQRNDHALLFAATQIVENTVGEMLDARRLKRRLNRPRILMTWHAEQIVVRHAPQFDNLPNGIGELYRKFLRRDRQPSRHLAPREARMSSPCSRTTPACGAQSPAPRRRSVDLPAPFGPSKPTISPAASWKLTSRTTCRRP